MDIFICLQEGSIKFMFAAVFFQYCLKENVHCLEHCRIDRGFLEHLHTVPGIYILHQLA